MMVINGRERVFQDSHKRERARTRARVLKHNHSAVLGEF